MRTLRPGELRATCDAATLPFESTAELPPIESIIGQDRAVRATTFGIAMHRAGYNLFVLGPTATGKATTMRRVLSRRVRDEATASDWCYVHNFKDPYRPIAVPLPAGRGIELRTQMIQLAAESKVRVPEAFGSEEFERQKGNINDDLEKGRRAELDRLREFARPKGITILPTPHGIAVAPAPEDEPLKPEQFMSLPVETREKLAAAGKVVEERADATIRAVRALEREARHEHERIVRELAAGVIHRLVQEVGERFAGLEGVRHYLDQVEEDLIGHAESFRQLSDGEPTMPFQPPADAFLERYRVNVLVDRSGTEGAPLVVEENPTYSNLVGRIEHRFQMGTMLADFTLIKPGALHMANGGYLMLEANEVLRNLQAWDALKNALKSQSIRISEPMEEFRLNTAGLAPEPIPLSLKVVLVGNPRLYYLLYELDEDFRELFKVKVDFDTSLPRTAEFELLYARFIGTVCQEESWRPFAPTGVAQLIEHGSRVVSHQERLTSKLGELRDLIRESAFSAEQREHPLVTDEDVRHAIAERIHRSNLIEEQVGRAFAEGTLLIATEGEAVGQLNGIAVLAVGDHAFGRPSRITARVYAGEPGVIDIEREAKLGGRTHSKGVMILTGFLAGRYAREQPLALAASIAFEQHYEEIDGDSASSAELYALLSALSGLPLSQSLAVTGAVSQHGEIQPVGGVNEKIEGFFDLCKARGLSGTQGVLIPATNVRHLMLRDDVVDAVRAGHFHIHAISTVDEGLTVLSGRPAGERAEDGHFPEGTFNAAVEHALAAGLERLKQLHGNRGT